MEIWRKKIRVCVSLLLLVLTTACYQQFQGGFPKHATLPKEGGKITLVGQVRPFGISIEGEVTVIEKWWYNNEEDPDTVFIQYNWLTVARKVERDNRIELSAPPNTSHKKRRLCVVLDFGGIDGEILVTQKE